jgi:DNA-binding NtrC family response regulator
MPIPVPALREHPADIPLLLNHYVDLFNREFRKQVRGVTPEALDLLRAYRWPGNIRELRNAVERAMLLTEATWLGPADFPLGARRASASELLELPEEGVNLETLERELLVQALRRTAGNQTRAAALLGLNRDQIRYRVEKFGLEKTAD